MSSDTNRPVFLYPAVVGGDPADWFTFLVCYRWGQSHWLRASSCSTSEQLWLTRTTTLTERTRQGRRTFQTPVKRIQRCSICPTCYFSSSHNLPNIWKKCVLIDRKRTRRHVSIETNSSLQTICIQCLYEEMKRYFDWLRQSQCRELDSFCTILLLLLW
jgi:hypothetical protein